MSYMRFYGKNIVLLTAVVSLTALAAGCSSEPTTPAAGAGITGDVTVFAAASLMAPFTELGTQFEAAHPGTTVAFSFAGSSDLVTQLTQGAPADVFASADTTNMTKATDADLVAGMPVDFATNTLTIVTPPGNPSNITSFADLATSGAAVVVCARQVPCGSATAEVEKATATTLSPVSEESSVTDVLGKVTSGQADAGVVYVTDAIGAGDEVDTVSFPESSDAVNTYPIAALKDASNASAARAFCDFVAGAAGRDVLATAGFAAP